MAHGRKRSVTESVLFEHNLSRFDYDSDLIAILEAKLLGTASRNDAFDLIRPDLDHDVGHDISELDLHNFAFDLVSG